MIDGQHHLATSVGILPPRQGAIGVLHRARASGRCPPSLLGEDNFINEDGFGSSVARVLDVNGMSLGSNAQLADSFVSLLQMAKSAGKIPGDASKRVAALEQRRCIILAIVASTPTNNHTLERIVSKGFLTTVKAWLDDILNSSVGGVDLLLHLLSSIAHLPVTKSTVKESGMGRAIGSIERHKICAGSPNETAIKQRVQQIKDAWNKSVKLRKEKNVTSATINVPKRDLESPTSPASKRVRTDDKKSSKFLSLVGKVSLPKVKSSISDKERAGAASASSKLTSKIVGTLSTATLGAAGAQAKLTQDAAAKVPPKKPAMRVKWADHFGGSLTASRLLEGEDFASGQTQATEAPISWSDRKKRDRLREKELLSQAKKAKILDDEDEGEVKPIMKVTRPWRQPQLLPDRPEITKAQLASLESTMQTERMDKVVQARYTTEYDVPTSPAPLSDVEQALDMTSQSSAVVTNIPFFVAQQTPPEPQMPPAPATISNSPYSQPIGTQTMQQISSSATASLGSSYPQTHSQGSMPATAETVQALGLPMFLVGQNTQALQTLASSPGLLNTFVDASGMYDPTRLLSLVQTLSQNIAPAPAQAPVPAQTLGTYQQPNTAGYSAAVPSAGIYGPASTTAATPQQHAGASFGPAASAASAAAAAAARNGYRGDQNNAAANLHLSGYGPTATEAEIITLFLPYVQVDEVVMKGTFCFVNTSDPVGAKRAREALNGALLGGMPVRINIAQRKSRESGTATGSLTALSTYGSSTIAEAPQQQTGITSAVTTIPKAPAAGHIDFESVRDDRGNPATKNLFVAGYGQGTTETQIRELFGQHATIIGIVMKGTFSFVNTSDRMTAVEAREALTGAVVNGGVLRINFAKETGRLGTSFDLTYGPGSSGSTSSHYGRGY